MWHTHQRLIALQRAKGWPNIQITRAPPRLTCRALHLSPPPELGIDLGAILRSVKAILLHQMRSPALDSLDFGGALVLLLALGGLHLLVR